MRDEVSTDRVAKLHPKIRDEVVMAIEDAEDKFPSTIKIRIVQGLRTIAEQDALYAKGRTTPGGVVTKAKGGSSYHNYGLALDFAIMYDKDNNGTFEELSWDIAKDFDKNGIADWQVVVDEFEKKGWSWGGEWRTFKDYPHVEKTFGYKWQQLFDKWKAKDFIPGTEYLNI